MVKNKSISIFMAIIMFLMVPFVSLSNIFTVSAETSTNPVQLYYAKSPEYHPTGSFFAEGYVSVANLGINKKVIIHYTYNGNTWQDTEAYYYNKASDGYEAWYFKTPSTNDFSSITFAIKYEVNGNTYWDNNNGQNYKLKWYSPTSIVQKSNLFLKSAFKNADSLSGYIILKNIAPEKQVKIRYTTDNWATYKEANASFDYSYINNLEYWKFNITGLPANATVKFAISYTVNGVTYWDNNFGKNYTY